MPAILMKDIILGVPPILKFNSEIQTSLSNSLVYFTKVRYPFSYIWPEEKTFIHL